MISQKELKRFFSYNEDSGIFRWISPPKNQLRAGQIAGSLHPDGYVHIKFQGQMYKAHRLAWLYVYGKLPDGEIDHINGIRDDNRILNLRDVSRSENQHNRGKNKKNTTGFVGVKKIGDVYMAVIGINGTKKHLGCFDTAAEASAAYSKEKEKIYPNSYRFFQEYQP